VSDHNPLAFVMPDLPALQTVMTTASNVEIPGFRSSGDAALTWWRRLRDSHPQTGFWPLLLDIDAPAYFAADFGAPPEASIALASTIDGAEVLAERGRDRLRRYPPELAAALTAELDGQAPWPDEPRRPGHLLPFDYEGSPVEVTVALIPATAGWHVPAVLSYGGWNDYPDPAEHCAILRYWHERYEAELVAMTGTTAEFAVGRPPATQAGSLALAWEYKNYNDGEYDYYDAETITELAAALLKAPVWLCWWD